MARGVFENSCFGVDPLRGPRGPGSRVRGAAGGSGPGRAVPERAGLRKQRGRKDKGATGSNGGEAGMGGQRKGGLFCFGFLIVLLSSGYSKGKQRTAIKGL